MINLWLLYLSEVLQALSNRSRYIQLDVSAIRRERKCEGAMLALLLWYTKRRLREGTWVLLAQPISCNSRLCGIYGSHVPNGTPTSNLSRPLDSHAWAGLQSIYPPLVVESSSRQGYGMLGTDSMTGIKDRAARLMCQIFLWLTVVLQSSLLH